MQFCRKIGRTSRPKSTLVGTWPEKASPIAHAHSNASTTVCLNIGTPWNDYSIGPKSCLLNYQSIIAEDTFRRPALGVCCLSMERYYYTVRVFENYLFLAKDPRRATPKGRSPAVQILLIPTLRRFRGRGYHENMDSGFIIRYTFPLPRLTAGQAAAHQTSAGFHFFKELFVQVQQFANSAFRTLQHRAHGVLISRPQIGEADSPNIMIRIHTFHSPKGTLVLSVSGPADHPENCVAPGLSAQDSNFLIRNQLATQTYFCPVQIYRQGG